MASRFQTALMMSVYRYSAYLLLTEVAPPTLTLKGLTLQFLSDKLVSELYTLESIQ